MAQVGNTTCTGNFLEGGCHDCWYPQDDIGAPTFVGSPLASAVATEASTATSAAALQHARENCNACRGANPATQMPYSYIVGRGLYYDLWGGAQGGGYNFNKEWAPKDCNEFLVGATPDCPTPAGSPGACQFSSSPAIETYSPGNIVDTDTTFPSGEGLATGCPLYNYVCTKQRYDLAFAAPCCLGQVKGLMSFTTPAFGTSMTATLPADSVLCDYRWCPLDPWGACESVFASACAGSESKDGGKTWVSALLGDGPCGAWYQGALGALAGEAPLSRWPVVDGIIENYCSNPANSSDSVSCACYNLSSKPNTQLYTSYSGGRCTMNGAPSSVCPVMQTNAQTGNTLNVSDYACIAPECHSAALLTHDVWGRQRQGGCPNICLQIVTDGDVVLSGDTIDGGVYINNSTMQCGGPQGSMTTTATPVLASLSDRVDVFWPHYKDNASACPTQPEEGGGCTPQPIGIAFALDQASTYGKNGAIAMPYQISFSPDILSDPTVYGGLYSDLSSIPPAVLAGTLSNIEAPNVTTSVVFQVNVNASSVSGDTVAHAAVPPGNYPLTITIRDTDPNPAYSSVFRSIVINTQVYDSSNPAPPQGPPAPNGGQGPPVIYDKTPPSWVWYAVGAVAFVLLLLFVHCLVLLAQRHTLKNAVASSMLSIPSMPSMPSIQKTL